MTDSKFTYGFFPGCSYASAAGYKESVDAVNEVLGIRFIELEDWNCCGATVSFSMDRNNALAQTGRLFAIANAMKLDQIVTICNACYTTLRKAHSLFSKYPELLAQANEHLAGEKLEIERLIPVRHHLEVLVHDIPESIWHQNLKKSSKDIRVAAYYGCQLTRPWGDIDHAERPEMLDRFIERIGFTPVEHSARTACCGASHNVAYPGECRVLISRILDEVKRKHGQMITTLCPLCQFNLDAGQLKGTREPLPVPYFTQLAGIALGLDAKQIGLNKLLIPLKI